MHRLQACIEELNRALYNPVGLNILWPYKVAFLFVSFPFSRQRFVALIHSLKRQLEIEYYVSSFCFMSAPSSDSWHTVIRQSSWSDFPVFRLLHAHTLIPPYLNLYDSHHMSTSCIHDDLFRPIHNFEYTCTLVTITSFFFGSSLVMLLRVCLQSFYFLHLPPPAHSSESD